jgi:hypothetical protein
MRWPLHMHRGLHERSRVGGSTGVAFHDHCDHRFIRIPTPTSSEYHHVLLLVLQAVQHCSERNHVQTESNSLEQKAIFEQQQQFVETGVYDLSTIQEDHL